MLNEDTLAIYNVTFVCPGAGPATPCNPQESPGLIKSINTHILLWIRGQDAYLFLNFFNNVFQTKVLSSILFEW